MLVERCFYALDRSRIMFRDIEHRCPVAQVDAETVEEIVGVCLMVQPELAVGTVVVLGAIVVAAAITAEIEAARARRGCTCFCAAPNLFLGDGNVKVKDKAACQRYCSATYPQIDPVAVCK